MTTRRVKMNLGFGKWILDNQPEIVDKFVLERAVLDQLVEGYKGEYPILVERSGKDILRQGLEYVLDEMFGAGTYKTIAKSHHPSEHVRIKNRKMALARGVVLYRDKKMLVEIDEGKKEMYEIEYMVYLSSKGDTSREICGKINEIWNNDRKPDYLLSIIKKAREGMERQANLERIRKAYVQQRQSS